MWKNQQNEDLCIRLQEIFSQVELKENGPVSIQNCGSGYAKPLTLVVKRDCLIIIQGKGLFKRKYRVHKDFLQQLSQAESPNTEDANMEKCN